VPAIDGKKWQRWQSSFKRGLLGKKKIMLPINLSQDFTEPIAGGSYKPSAAGGSGQGETLSGLGIHD